MVTGTGKPGVCLDNISAGTVSPEPAGPDQKVRVNSSKCVFLTCDGKDCIALLERCAWCISQGLCIRPGAVEIQYRGAGQ